MELSGVNCTLFSSKEQPANVRSESKQFKENASVALQQSILTHAHTKCPIVGVVKRFARRPASRIYKILLDLQMQSQLFVNLHTSHVQPEKEKLMQKSGLHNMEHHPDRRQFKDYYVISALVNLSAGARYTN